MASPFGAITAYYDRLVGQYGHDPRACDYGRPESQAAKFRVLAGATDYSGRSVLDVGCGFADFADALRRRFPDVRYHGVDLSPAMIARAKALRPDLDLRVANLMDLPGEGLYDVVTANGVFYLLGAEAPSLMPALVARMFSLARSVVAFNSLSAWAPDQDEGEFYADPAAALAFCRALTPRVVLRHDYHPRDFTLYLYKGDAR